MTTVRLFVVVELLQLAFIAGCAPTPSGRVDDAAAYRIVQTERLKKGGDFNLPAPPIYLLIRADAALTSEHGLSDERVGEVLTAIVLELRHRHAPDAVSVSLYQSLEHVGRARPIGRGEWWPRGHSLARSNAHNVSNKDSYVLDLRVERLPERRVRAERSRISHSKKREIFDALVRSQDRADKEAEETYPTDPSVIPISRFRSYDFETAIRRKLEESDRLATRYRRDLLAKHRISEEELEAISQQALEENWPLPD